MTSSPDIELRLQSVRAGRRLRCEPTRTDPARVIANLLRMLARVLGPAVDVRTTLDPSAGQVLLDPAQLEQVVLNLAVNDATHEVVGSSPPAPTYLLRARGRSTLTRCIHTPS